MKFMPELLLFPLQSLFILGIEPNNIALINPFASEAVYTRNFFSDRLSDSV